MTRTRRALAVLALVPLATACAVAGYDAAAADPGMVRIVLPEEPPTLDPCMNSQTSTGRVARGNITEGLTFRDPATSEVHPLLATAWTEISPTVWRFTLRHGVRFHDGTTLDAADVVASVNRVLAPDLSCDVAAQFFAEVDLHARAIDPTTVELTTGPPDPILPLRMSFLGITPQSTNPKARVREPVGTGPYEIGSWDVGTSLTLRRFDGYWGKRPAFAAARYVWRTEDSIRAAMITSGETDVATSLSPEDKYLDGAITFDTNETAYLRMDPNQQPMTDVRVRRAINYALDRHGILRAVFGGVGSIATQLVPPGVVGHDDAIHEWPYDPDKARALIAAAKADGVPVDTPITIIGRENIYPRATEAMEVVQSELTAVGLTVRIRMLDVNAWLEYALRPFVPDAGPTLLQGQHGNQAGDASFTMANNYGTKGGQSTYGTPQLDALIRTAETASAEQRQQDFAAALAYQNDHVVRDAVMIRVGGIIALSDRVAYHPDSATNDEMRLADMTRKDRS